MEESTAVAVQTRWVPPAEGVIVVEEQATGFVVEGGLAAEVRGEAGWGIHLASGERNAPDWRAELSGASTAAANVPSGSGSVTVSGNATSGSTTSGSAFGSTASGAAIASDHIASDRIASDRTASGSTVVAGHRSVAVPSPGSPAPQAGAAGGALIGPSTASTQGRAEARFDFEVPAARPRDGVWGLDGRATSLGALVDGGVQVDGVRIDLAELEALAGVELGGPPARRLSTDGALQAFAELEHDTLPRSGGQTQVVVQMRGAAAPDASRGPVRVHLVLDRSSSMQRTWPRVIASARALIDRLRPQDQLQIVAYGTDVVEAFPLGQVGDGRAARAALGSIVVGGGTHIEGGLSMAYEAAARANGPERGLVLLLSDGVPNHGAFEPSELSALAVQARERSGCTTGVVGLGTEFDARLLRAISEAGRGGYHVAVNIDGLAQELEGELDAYARAAARDVSVTVRLAPGVELLGEGPFQATAEGARVSFPQLAAGEARRVVLPVRVAASATAGAVASVRVRYQSRLSAGWVTADRALSVSRGAQAVPSGIAFSALLDRSLGRALDRAATSVRRGDGRAAADFLRSHAHTVEGRAEHASSAPLQARARVVRRAARALEALTPASGHGLRRRVSVNLGAIAARIGR